MDPPGCHEEECRKRWLAIPVMSTTIRGATLAHAAQPLNELQVSAISDEEPNELMRIYQRIAEDLSRELRMKVSYTNVVDYAAAVEGLAPRKLDMVWYGGFTYVQARKRMGDAAPLVSREEDLQYHSHFITRKDTGITRLAELKGKSFSFGQEAFGGRSSLTS